MQSNNASPVASFFSVRGIGTLAFVKSIEQSVGISYDGVPLVRPETGVLAFYDINDVEVLNGPQGMLFGKNLRPSWFSTASVCVTHLASVSAWSTSHTEAALTAARIMNPSASRSG